MDRIGAHPFLKPASRAGAGVEGPCPTDPSTATQGAPARLPLAFAGIVGFVTACWLGAAALIGLLQLLPSWLLVLGIGAIVAYLVNHLLPPSPAYLGRDDVPVISSLFESRFER